MTDSAKTLGYGGTAKVDGLQVLVLTGSFEDAISPSYLEMLSIPPTDDSRSRVLHADGTAAYSGSISFDVSVNSLPLLNTGRLLERRFQFDVTLDDAESVYELSNCYATSVSASGAPGGLINASVSFIAAEAKGSGSAGSYILNYGVDPNDQPAAYWWSGATDVRDWTLSYTQDAQPVYGNEQEVDPKYLRVGLISYTLQVTTYSPLDHDAVAIMTDSFTLTGATTARGYTFNGPTELGMYSHTFETSADATTGSGAIIIT